MQRQLDGVCGTPYRDACGLRNGAKKEKSPSPEVEGRTLLVPHFTQSTPTAPIRRGGDVIDD